MTIVFSTQSIITLSAGAKQSVPFPPQLANSRVIGFDVQNFSSFNMVLVGIPNFAAYPFLPYQGMYIPLSHEPQILGIQPLQSPSVTLLIGTTPWFPQNESAGGDIGGYVQFTAYLDGDPTPSLELVPYQLPVSQIGRLSQYFRNSIFSNTTKYADSTAAHSTSMSGVNVPVSTILLGGGLYLLYVGFQFESPGANAVVELVTLTDVNGVTIMEWDMQLGVGLGGGSTTLGKDLIFPFPGFLTSGVAAGPVQNWALNTPATVNGPAYSVVLYGYAI